MKASDLFGCLPSLKIRNPACRANQAHKETMALSLHRLAVTGVPGDGFSSPCSLAWPEYRLIADKNGSLAPLGRVFPFRISANGTKLPYRSRVSSLSCVTTEPFRSIPAKMPRARE